jgi:hypothetical protein
MAHFAEIDSNSIVLRVIVVDNSDILDDSGAESEDIGKAFCTNLLGGTWVQTSYNEVFRHKYAGISDTYNESLDAFVPRQPFDSWTFDPNSIDWIPPTPLPNDGELYRWNEDALAWELPA